MSVNNLSISVGTPTDQFSMAHGTLIKTADTIDETPVDIEVLAVSLFSPDGGSAAIIRESDGAKQAFAYEGINKTLNKLSSCTLASGSFDFIANDKIEL